MGRNNLTKMHQGKYIRSTEDVGVRPRAAAKLRLTESERVVTVKRNNSLRRCYSERMLATPPDTVPYYYGHISRENAEHILWRHGGKDGMYLLRASLSSDTDYVLSLCFNKQVRHYRITKDALGMHCLDGYVNEKYHGPVELVENIRALPCKPVIPVIKPLHLFMPGVNCGITEEKLQTTLRKKAREWGLEAEMVNNVSRNRDSEIWKLLLHCIHEVESWFHGKIPRGVAERRLMETPPENGKFLIRQRDDCSFSLSLCYNGTVKHYKIDIMSSGEVAIQEGPRFDNLISLVSHYSVFSDGLWCNLQTPCINPPVQTDPHNDSSDWSPSANNWTTKHNDMNVVNASDSNSEFHSTSPLNSALTISPIAAARSGQLSSVQKPKNEVQPKSGFGKFSLGSLFKISNRGIIEPKSTAKQSREKKTSLTSQTPPLIEWPTRKSPPQHCSTNGVFQPIDFHQNTLRVPPSPLNLSDLTTLSPTIDQNHNDCKSNFVTIPTTPSSSSPVDDTKIVNIGIDSDGKVSEPARTSPEGQLLPFGRPLPVPRQRPPVVPRLFNPPKVSSDDFTIDNGSPKTVAKSADSTGSLNKLSPETPTEKLIPKLNNVFAFHESSSCSSDLENRTDLESSDKVVNENCNNQPRNASPTSNVSKPLLLGKIAQPAYMKELKFHPVMNSQKTDTNREPKVPEGQSTVGESRNTNDEERVNGNLYTSNPKLMKLISSKTHCEPSYEEIDPEYESSKDEASSTGSSPVEEAVSMPDIVQPSADSSPASLISSQVEEAKWDDTNEETLPSSSGTSKTFQRRSPWTKEESEFHFKTIKRHRKGPCSIDRKHLSFQERLGFGNFGEVIKAVFKSGTDEVLCAVKTLRPSSVSSARTDILREAHIMTRLDHPHIVRLLGVSEGDPFLLVMELASLGPLNLFLKKNPNFPVRDVLVLMHQVALGMEYLESKQFVHRDLAARNVLLVNESFAKISDFGMSKVIGLDSDYYKVEPKGKLPLKWYAPECIYFFRFSSKSDVWSYGITLWEALSYGDKPYLGMTGREILTMFSSESRLSCPERCPGEIYDMMWNCWQIRPEDRPTFSELVIMLKEYLNI